MKFNVTINYHQLTVAFKPPSTPSANQYDSYKKYRLAFCFMLITQTFVVKLMKFGIVAGYK